MIKLFYKKIHLLQLLEMPNQKEALQNIFSRIEIPLNSSNKPNP